MKQLFKFLKPFLVAIGLILIFESIVFPGLSAASTVTNVLALLAAIIAGYFAYNFYKQCYFSKPEPKAKPKRSRKEQYLGGGESFFKEATTITVVKPKRKPRAKKQ